MSSFLFGTPEKNYQRQLLEPGQMPLKNQLFRAGQERGAGGAFGTAADYYRNLLSDESADYNEFAAPEMRRFREEIVPSLSEQFAGMGSGGLSSSGFRNAQVNAGTDLAERLGAIRAQLRQQGVQGLQNIGQQGLQQYTQNVTRPGTEGFLGSALGPALGALGTAFGGPMLGAASTELGEKAKGWFAPKKGSTGFYGGQPSSPKKVYGQSPY